MEPIRDRLDVISDAVADLRVHVARVEGQLNDNTEQLAKVLREVGGVTEPTTDRRSLRRRIHDLENDRRAVEIATQALRAEQRKKGLLWSRRGQIGLFLFAGIGALGAFSDLLGRLFG